MKQITFKKILPHLIAIAIFLIVALVVCRPALESGVTLKQSDITTWQGMSHQIYEHQKETGVLPLWVSNMFSGMPAYQIGLNGGFNPLLNLDGLFKLWLPVPMNFFFLACISFYFLGICLRVRPYAAIFGAIAFAYCSFSPIIITAGHNTEMLALAYAPAVIGGCILIFDRKYLLGFTLTAVLTSLQIAQGHQQVSYYLFLILGIMTIAFIVRLVKEKQTKHLLVSCGLMITAGLLAILLNAVTLFPTYDYVKASKRGGQLVMPGDVAKADEKVVDGKTSGLSKSYAFQWSYGKAETMTLMFPGVMGYGNHQAQRDGETYQFPNLGENASAVKFVTDKFGAPQEQASGYASGSLYWGKQPFTNGPVYLGAIVCFLFIMSLFYLDNKHKWWLLAASTFGILLALGNNLPGFNGFMFDHFPLYNKFRVPTMALIIPQILFPIGAVLFLDKLARTQQYDWKNLKYGGIATAAVFVLALAFYASSDFANENRARTTQFNQIVKAGGADMNTKLNALNESIMPEKDNQVYEGMVANMAQNPNAQEDARSFVTALRKDRASVFLGDIGRSFIYVLLSASLIFFYCRKKLNANILLIGSIALTLLDQVSFAMNYLNKYNFDSSDAYEQQEFPLTKADQQILADKSPNFRVFDLTSGSPFESSRASYYHKSIGGNHAAKLGIYDDLTAHQLSGQPNQGVLDMLNTKYVMQQQGKETIAMLNPGALGNVWFVKGVKFANGPVAEMTALNNFNPKDTAVVDESYKAMVTAFVAADSSASIKETSFDNDKIVYESNAAQNHVAVFSEIFYKDWKAIIDGKPADYFKADYVLRAMIVPAGKHTITFSFEPQVFFTSKIISQVTGWVLILLIIFCIYVELKRKQNTNTVTDKNEILV